MDSARLKILITAHEFSPSLGSECSSAWNIITRLGRFHDVTVLFAETNQFKSNNYKTQVEDFIIENNISGLRFVPIPQPYLTSIIAKVNRFISNKQSNIGLSGLYFLGVRFWERHVYDAVSHILCNEEYDILHHFNHLSFREPGFLWRINKPFVWGPISGFSQIPSSFYVTMPSKEVLKNRFRNFFNILQSTLSMRVRKAIQKSTMVYFVTEDDEKLLKGLGQNSKHLLDIGTEPKQRSMAMRKSEDFISVLWVGRIDHLKALYILLNAVAGKKLLLDKIELTIIGDGPQFTDCKKHAMELGITKINWLGSIPKNDVESNMLLSDVLVHTSIKEAASAVVLEALSAGLPIICHDGFGMRFSINSTCGIKVPIVSPRDSINGFADALEGIVLDHALLESLKLGAVQRSKELTWDSISERISKDYMEINAQSQIDK